MKYGHTFIIKNKYGADLPHVIVMRFRYHNLCAEFGVGHSIEKSKWSSNREFQGPKKGAVNHRKIPGHVIFADMIALAAIVETAFLKFRKQGIVPTVAELREAVKRANEPIPEEQPDRMTFELLCEIYQKQSTVTSRRMDHIRVVCNMWSKYSEENNVSSYPDEILPEEINDFEKKVGKGRGKNRVIGIMKILRSIFAWAQRTGNINESPFVGYRIQAEVYGRPVCLSKAERDYLTTLEISPAMQTIMYDNDEKNISGEVLSRTRDMFILQCHIGCRVSDFNRLTKANIVDDTVTYIPTKSINKQIDPISVPLSGVAKGIISLYQNSEETRLMPFISPQKYNDNIKYLFCFAGLNRKIVRLNTVTRREEKIEIYKVAGSHLARRTFINILHKSVKNEVIASMTGHTKDSRAFSRYYDIDKEQKINAIKTVLE